jgi:hypothetical protein
MVPTFVRDLLRRSLPALIALLAAFGTLHTVPGSTTPSSTVPSSTAPGSTLAGAQPSLPPSHSATAFPAPATAGDDTTVAMSDSTAPDDSPGTTAPVDTAIAPSGQDVPVDGQGLLAATGPGSTPARQSAGAHGSRAPPLTLA